MRLSYGGLIVLITGCFNTYGIDTDETTDTNDDTASQDSGEDTSEDTGEDTSEDTDTGGEDTGVEDTDTGGDTSEPTYDHTGFSVGAEISARDSSYQHYTAWTSLSEPFDLFILDFHFNQGATDGAHSYTFTGENYEDCHTCLLVEKDCDEEYQCDQFFLVTGGSVSITSMGSIGGGSFQGTGDDLEFSEVTMDWMSGESTLVTSGETWFIDSMTFDASVDPW